MAWQAKFTAQRGKVRPKDIPPAAGSAEAQSDTISVNMDITNMSKGEAVTLLEAMVDRVQSSKWPPL